MSSVCEQKWIFKSVLSFWFLFIVGRSNIQPRVERYIVILIYIVWSLLFISFLIQGLGTSQGKYNHQKLDHQTVELNQISKDNYEKSGHQTAKLNQILEENYEKPGHQTTELKLIPQVAKDDNEEIQYARKKLIADKCEETGIVSPATQFLVDERHELLYCYIPKVLSSVLD